MNVAQQLANVGIDPNSSLTQAQQHAAIIKNGLPEKAPTSQITVTLTNNTGAAQYFSIMNNNMATNSATTLQGQLSYAAFAGIIYEPTNEFLVSVQHPAGIDGFRGYFRENHLLAPGFAYNVGVSTAVSQFQAGLYYVTLSKDLKTQINTSLADAVTQAQTGNTLTNFAIIVNTPIALTQCSDLVIQVNAGVQVILTFQSQTKNRTR